MRLSGTNVVVDGVVGYLRPVLEAEAAALAASHAEVDIELVDLPALSLREPAALDGGIGERGEDARRDRRIGALDDEGAVDDRWGAHGLFFLFWSGSPASCSARSSPSRSRRRSHSVMRSLIHWSASLSPSGSMLHVRTRPTFSVRITPLSSRIWRCWTTAASETPTVPPSWLTEPHPRLSRPTMPL